MYLLTVHFEGLIFQNKKKYIYKYMHSEYKYTFHGHYKFALI